MPSNIKYDVNKPFHKKKYYITPDEFDAPDIKILVLGAGDSGKSYLLNHFKYIFLHSTSDEERNNFADIIRKNTISYIQSLIESYKSYGYSSENKQLLESISKVNNLKLNADELTPEIAECIKMIWENSDFQTVYDMTKTTLDDEYNFYFLDSVSRIAKSDYIPTDNDIIRVPERSTFIKSFQFRIENKIKVEIVDVGGQKCERSKWQHAFVGVNLLFFVISFADFDDFMFEDDTLSRTKETINLLTTTCTSPVFIEKPVLNLFYNKDLFEKKIEGKAK